MIKKCDCNSTTGGKTEGANYQDKAYGKSNRVMNKTGSGYRCTVCGFDQTTSTFGKKKK